MNKYRREILCWLGAVGLVGCDTQRAPDTAAPSFYATDITGAAYGQKLSMLDVNGQVRSLADFTGKVSVLFFGFTHCPDVCPTAMQELAQVKLSMGAEGERVQGIFVTVDPERDTPEVLKRYMASFDPSFIALRGTLEQTRVLTKEFKAFFAKTPNKASDSYTVEHTAGSYVFDPQGRLRLFVRYGAPAQELTADLRQLLAVG